MQLFIHIFYPNNTIVFFLRLKAVKQKNYILSDTTNNQAYIPTKLVCSRKNAYHTLF